MSVCLFLSVRLSACVSAYLSVCLFASTFIISILNVGECEDKIILSLLDIGSEYQTTEENQTKDKCLRGLLTMRENENQDANE